MGMGYSACMADTVEQSFVEEVCPTEFASFIEALKAEDESLESIGYSLEVGDYSEDIETAYQNLQSAFSERTGLTLSVGYHDSESEGSRYDDVDGVYWSVGNVFMRTPAGEKYKDKITRSHFVTFG